VHVARVLVETEKYILLTPSAAPESFATVSLRCERWYGWSGASYQVGRHGEVSLARTVRDSVHTTRSWMERVVRRAARSTGASSGVTQSNVNGTSRAAVSDVSEDVHLQSNARKQDVARTVALGAMRGAARMVGD